MFNIPPGIALILLVLTLIHAVRTMLPDALDEEIVARLAFVPGCLTFLFDPGRVGDSLIRLAAGSPEDLRQAEIGRFFLEDGGSRLWTLLTYGLLHANWTHLIVNSIWLLAFGTPIARRVGTGRLIAFLSVTSVAGALVHTLTNLVDFQPVIGASAAVSGCMGGTLRFMFQQNRSASAIFGVRTGDGAPILRQPLLSVAAMLKDRRVMTFAIAWFATNLLFGLGSVAFGLSDFPVAWQAHIGGFLAGALLFPLFDRPMSLVAPGYEPDDPADWPAPPSEN